MKLLHVSLTAAGMFAALFGCGGRSAWSSSLVKSRLLLGRHYNGQARWYA